jgi:ATP-dependent Clp protease, protease subunit
VMIHAGSAGFGGATPDTEIQAQHILRTTRRVNEVLAYHTGQPIERIVVDASRDFWMTAEQAIDYGCVDSILTPAQEPLAPARDLVAHTNGVHAH